MRRPHRSGTTIALGLLLSCVACSQTPGGSEKFKIAFVPSTPGQYGIFSMNSDTTGSKILTTDKNAQLRFASWSPDGKRIAFYSLRGEDADILKKYNMRNEYLLYVMDATGGNQKRLLDFPVVDFAWAPDGQHLFFISSYESPDRNSMEVLNGIRNSMASVYILDLQTGGKTRLPGTGRNVSASWSPDGTRLAVGFGDPEDGGLYLISADGGHRERLTNGATIDYRPMWSPDGKSIAYVAFPKTDADAKDAGVFVVAADGTGKRRVDLEVVSYVMWSPDGSRLLLQSANGTRLIDCDGTKQVLLSAGLRRMMNAFFTPDGKSVIFCSNDSGAWNIYSIDLGGQKRRTMTGRTNSSNYCLSPLLASR